MMERLQGYSVLAGSVVLMLVLGSVHAFSVFLEAMETTFHVSRASSSITYSLALITLTVFVLYGHHFFRRLTSAQLAIVVCLVASIGCLLAAYANHIALVWIGYGVLFGAANGLGYAYALQFSAQANPYIGGSAMGLVTASYGLGAAVAPLPLYALLNEYGFQAGMIGLSITLIAIGPIVAFLFAQSKRNLIVESTTNRPATAVPTTDLMRLWVAYGTAVFSGLMVIGHATGIAQSVGLNNDQLYIAPMVIALANVVGSLLGGYLLDKLGTRKLLSSVAFLSTFALVSMSIWPVPSGTLLALGVVGFSYGATIAAFPAAISKSYGSIDGIRIYGKVFTAWGTAGLIAPWSAGILYEWTGGYTVTILLAALFGIASIAAVLRLPHGNTQQS